MMRTIFLTAVAGILFTTGLCGRQAGTAAIDTVASLLDTLAVHAAVSDASLLQRHFKSISALIEDRDTLSASEKRFLGDLYLTFADPAEPWNSGELTTYLERKRPLIIAWKSPTDSVLSLGWLFLPLKWDSLTTYPLYVILHGLYGPYQNTLEYMGIHFQPALGPERSFADGYAFYPWGRGNIWYRGIGDTDIWEGISFIESIVHVDRSRKYIAGHSMGGFGSWTLAQKSPGTWAAVGVYAGALWYDSNCMTQPAVEKLKDVPVYIVCGTSDGLLSQNQEAYQMLTAEGNEECHFTTFEGGHVSLLENWVAMFEWMKNYTLADASSIGGSGRNGNPKGIYLESFPNPSSGRGGTTTITYRMESGGDVRLQLFDLLGREVALLFNGTQNAGIHEVRFNANYLPSGTYFCRLSAGRHQETRKILFVR